MQKPVEISVMVVCFNEERYIKNCLESLFNQTIKDYELIIVDDGSHDNTLKEIYKCRDGRIQIINNGVNLGVAASRNIGIAKAKGKICFFTDADCIVDAHWIEEGLKVFKNHLNILGIGGKTYYVTKEYKYDFRDRSNYLHNSKDKFYSTCNVAYKRRALEMVQGFDVKYQNRLEDRELALKIRRYGDIVFCENMVVFHQKKPLTIKSILQEAKGQRARVYLFKEHKDKAFITKLFGINFLLARDLPMLLLFPLLLINTLLHREIRNFRDLYLYIMLNFISLFYRRIWIWITAFKERIFIL